MFCSISGEVPTEPVISKKSGHLYEKRLIDKYIREQGKCPVSGQELSELDLLPVLANKAVRPRSVATTGIPGLLGMLQNEWDELMLETFTLRQHLSATRQELSQALYQHDAACRVIARLLRERDEARALAMNNASSTTSDSAPNNGVAAGLAAEVLAAMEAKCEELSKARKTRGKGAPANLLPAADLQAFGPSATSAPSSSAAVTCLDVLGEGIVVGYADGTVSANNRNIKGHNGAVSGVSFVSGAADAFLSAATDGTVKLWRADASCVNTFTASADHSAVTSLRCHPTGILTACTLLSGGYSLVDINRGVILSRAPADHSTVTGDLHPDGLLLAGGGADGNVTIWDLRTQSQVAQLQSGAAYGVASVRFSENGYHLGGGAGNKALLWDLRKLMLARETEVASPVTSVAFDNSGSFLAMAFSNSIAAHTVKEWTPVMNLNSAVNGDVTALAWGADARSLVVGSSDGAVKVFRNSK